MEIIETRKKVFDENNLIFELTEEEKKLYFIKSAFINIEMLEIETLGSPCDLSISIEDSVMGNGKKDDINLQSYPKEIQKENGVYRFDTKLIGIFNHISPNIKITISSLSKDGFKLSAFFKVIIP
jgi:hypothetical protein